MWDIILDFIRDIYRKYGKPVRVLIMNGIFYQIFGSDKFCGTRCPAPPMTASENFFFTLFYIVNYICILWIFIIHMTDKYNDM